MNKRKYIKPTIEFLTYEDICEGETMVVSIKGSTENIDDVGAKAFNEEPDFTFDSGFDQWLWEE